MADENKAAETVDTAASTTTTETAAAPAQDAGKAAAPAKVDLARLIDEEGYAEKVLAEKAAQTEGTPDTSAAAGDGTAPPEEIVPASAAKPQETAAGEATIIVKYGDTEERVPVSRVQNQLGQAKHIQRIWQTEIAPLAKVVRDNPLLAQALEEAARGDNSRLQALLAGGGAGPKQDAPKEDERIDAMVKKLAGDKRFEGWKPDEIKANLTAIAAMQEALGVPAAQPGGDRGKLDQDFQAEAQALASESHRLRSVLEAANPAEHAETVGTINQVVKELYTHVQAGKLSEADFLHTVSLYNDPRNLDAEGRPMYLTLYRAAQEYNRQQKAGKAGAGASAPAARGGVNARIAPGAASIGGASSGGGLPSLTGKSREERIALMDSFMGV